MIPYLIWTCLYVSINIGLGRAQISVEYLLKAFVLGNAAKPFYYIVVLLYFTLLTPALAKTVQNKRVCYILLLFLCCMEILFYFLQISGVIDVFSNIIKYTPLWLVFYIIGMMYRKNKIRIPIMNSKLSLILAFILELAETLIMIRFNNTRPMAYSQMRISGFFFALCLLSVLLEINSDKPNKALHLFGDCSYGVFYVHCLVLIGVDFLLNRISIPYIVYVIAEFIICSNVSLILNIWLKKMIKNAKLRESIGIS